MAEPVRERCEFRPVTTRGAGGYGNPAPGTVLRAFSNAP